MRICMEEKLLESSLLPRLPGCLPNINDKRAENVCNRKTEALLRCCLLKVSPT